MIFRCKMALLLLFYFLVARYAEGVFAESCSQQCTVDAPGCPHACDVTVDDFCYWIALEDKASVKYSSAEKICAEGGSTLAYFRTQEAHDKVIEMVRNQIDEEELCYVWTGIKINDTTGKVMHPSGDVYTKWDAGLPYIIPTTMNAFYVVLHIEGDPTNENQGMINIARDVVVTNGAVCFRKNGFTTECNGKSISELSGEILRLRNAFGGRLIGEGWKKYTDGDREYFYTLSTDWENYEDATRNCQSMGAKLAAAGMRIPAIRNAVVNDIAPPIESGSWIGLNDLVTKGKYMWIDGVESTADNTNRDDNTINSTGERCGAIFNRIGFKINNENCDSKKRYLCEIEL